MKRKILILTAYFSLNLLLSANLFAESDLYSFPRISDGAVPKNKEMKPADLFAQILAKKMNVPEISIVTKINKGFGRTEIIRLILMSQKSGKPLAELFEEREKGTRFAKIAESLKLDNKKIRREANDILKQVLESEQKTKADQSHAEKPTAGVSEKSEKNSTKNKGKEEERKNEK